MGGVLERRVLTDVVAAGRVNVLATYEALARGVPGASVERDEAWLASFGPADLSYCNFAAGFDCEDPGRWNRLMERARKAPVFWAFTMAGDRPTDVTERLLRHGFVPRQSLAQMAWHGEATSCGPDWRLATGPEDRQAVAAFMAAQFFWRSPEASRTAIAGSTERSGLDLWGLWRTDGLAAAAMTVQTDDALGLYNLCVRDDLRRRGIGESLVVAVKSLSMGRPVVLQCEPALAPWYERQGFATFSFLDAFSLTLPSHGDIL